MPRTILFHMDEHCDPAIAAGLRGYCRQIARANFASVVQPTKSNSDGAPSPGRKAGP